MSTFKIPTIDELRKIFDILGANGNYKNCFALNPKVRMTMIKSTTYKTNNEIKDPAKMTIIMPHEIIGKDVRDLDKWNMVLLIYPRGSEK